MTDPIITSVRNPRVREAARLRDRRQRARQGRFLIDGFRELARALDAGVELIEVFLCPQLLDGDPQAAQLARRLEQASVPRVEVTPEVFDRLAYGERAEGGVGVAVVPSTVLAELVIPPVALVAVLVGLEKPGNVGAILRTADAVGVAAVIVADGGTDLFNPNTIRASLGTIFAQRLAAAPAAEVKAWLIARGLRIVTARVDATQDYTAVDFTHPTAIVLGSEADGLPAEWSGPGVTPVRLPMLGVADSLNVSATAAVLFYEALRQRSARTK